MKMNITKFPVSVLTTETQELYKSLYGSELGTQFIEILNTSPEEISIISKLIAYLYAISKEG